MLADGGPFALDEPPSLRALTLELCTQPTVDLSGCVNLRALNLTLWKVTSCPSGECLLLPVLQKDVCSGLLTVKVGRGYIDEIP